MFFFLAILWVIQPCMILICTHGQLRKYIYLLAAFTRAYSGCKLRWVGWGVPGAEGEVTGLYEQHLLFGYARAIETLFLTGLVNQSSRFLAEVYHLFKNLGGWAYLPAFGDKRVLIHSMSHFSDGMMVLLLQQKLTRYTHFTALSIILISCMKKVRN